MEAEKITVVLLADLVAGKNNNILRIVPFNERNVLINRICSAFVPVRAGSLLIWREYMYTAVKTIQIPGLSISNIFV